MIAKELALPKGSRVLVTGANGYIAFHVDQMLALGYTVKGTVRAPKPWLMCVISLLDVKTNSQRIFGFAEQANWTDIAPIFRTLRSNNRHPPDPPQDLPRDRTEVVPRVRAEGLSREFFGQAGWTGIQESLVKGIDGME
ncbi:hypothetical protein BDW62DRAFT_203641 [Aspergillus aurantiobrunneus]